HTRWPRDWSSDVCSSDLMRVIAYDPFVPPDRFRELGVERVATTDELYAASDFLTLHLPLTPDTQGTVGRAALAKMRDGVHIVNRSEERRVGKGCRSWGVR